MATLNFLKVVNFRVLDPMLLGLKVHLPKPREQARMEAFLVPGLLDGSREGKRHSNYWSVQTHNMGAFSVNSP